MDYRNLAAETDLLLASSWLPLPEFIFSGIAYLDEAILVGSSGMAQYRATADLDPKTLSDGRFSLFARSGDVYVARTDALGQDSIFFYCDGLNWALSNSFYALCQHLKECGAKLTAYLPALTGFFIEHSITHQLLSNRTGVAEIRVLPADSMLVVAPSTGQAWVKRTHRLDYEQRTDRADYAGLLVSHAAKWASRSAALVDAYGAQASADVTGGLDSRLVLSLLLVSGADLSRVNFISNPNMHADFAVAQSIAAAHDFEITNRSSSLIRPTAEDAYALWKHGNLGVYLHVYPALSGSIPDKIHFHGACGECYRDFYKGDAAGLISNIAGRAPEAVRPMLRNEFARGFDEAYSRDGEAVAMDHYRHFRSRFHFGRNWFRNLHGVMATPLASMDLVKAAGALSVHERERGQMYCDMLMLTSPKLATMPFDKPEKAFSAETLEASAFRTSRPDLAPMMREVKVYRSIRRAPQAVDSRGSFYGIMEREVASNVDRARSLGIFTRDYEMLAGSIGTAEKVPVGMGLAAAHIITSGEIVSICT